MTVFVVVRDKSGLRLLFSNAQISFFSEKYFTHIETKCCIFLFLKTLWVGGFSFVFDIQT